VSPWSSFLEVLDCRIHDNGLRSVVVNIAYGAYIETADNLVENTEIYNNAGYGLHFFNNSVPGIQFVNRNVIQKNRIHDNGINGGTNYGIVIASGDGNVAKDNLIYGNRGGMFLYTNSSNANVSNNTVYSNTPLEGILIREATRSVVRDNIVYGNGTDILDQGTATVLSNNRGP